MLLMNLSVRPPAVVGCGRIFGTWGPWMKRQDVRSLGKFHQDGVVGCRFAVIVLGEFCSQAPGLDSHHGVDLRIEIVLSTEYFGGDLIFLQRSAGMIQGMLGDIT